MAKRSLFAGVFALLIIGLNAAFAAETDYFFGGRMYTPDEYCNFGGGIPKAYIEICERLKPHSRQSEMARAIKSQHWVTIEADNGAKYAIDIGNIGRASPGAGPIIYTRMCQLDVDGHCIGGSAAIMNVRILWFDCRGHYADMTHPTVTAGWQVAPPYSVVGRASELACAHAKSLPNGSRPP